MHKTDSGPYTYLLGQKIRKSPTALFSYALPSFRLVDNIYISCYFLKRLLTNKIKVGKPEGKQQQIPRRRWQDNIKRDFKLIWGKESGMYSSYLKHNPVTGPCEHGGPYCIWGTTTRRLLDKPIEYQLL